VQFYREFIATSTPCILGAGTALLSHWRYVNSPNVSSDSSSSGGGGGSGLRTSLSRYRGWHGEGSNGC